MKFRAKFSESFKTTCIAFSPNGNLLAQSYSNKLLIRDVNNDLFIKKTFSVLHDVNSINWSFNGKYILCSCDCIGLIQVFSIDKPTWNCRIVLGDEIEGVGLIDHGWCGTTTISIFTTASHYTQMTIWSLVQKEVKSIRDIIPIEDYKSFNQTEEKMAILQFTTSFKKILTIFDTNTWDTINSFEVLGNDIDGVKWAPSSAEVITWDSKLFSNIWIYSPKGEIIKHLCPDGLSVGIQSIKFSPLSDIMAFVNYKNKLSLLNCESYGTLLEENLENSLPIYYDKCKIFVELTKEIDIGKSKYILSKSVPLDIINREQESDNQMIKCQIKFSYDGKFLAANSSLNPRLLWIWSMEELGLHSLIIQKDSIKCFEWCTLSTTLAIFTGNQNLYMCTTKDCFIISMSSDIDDHKFSSYKNLMWNVNKNIIVSGKDEFVIGSFENFNQL